MEGVLSKRIHNPDSYHNGIKDTQVKAEEKIWNESEAVSNSNSPPCVMQEKCATFNNFQNTTSSSSSHTHLFNGSEDLEEQLLHSIRPDSKIVVNDLLEKIRQLSLLQKMLLYLKLPPSTDDPDCIDPLRKPLNPLGNRLEVSQALAYIKSHFLPDPDVSLPKKDIYNEYTIYCLRRKTKPLSTADFGKAMKQVYPVVRPRRLGERGNSRYCYSGLRNRDHLSKPNTPQFPNCQVRDDVSSKICTWASTILKTQVKNLTELSSIISSNPVSIQSEHVQDSGNEVLQERFLKGLADRKRKFKPRTYNRAKEQTDRGVRGLSVVG
ncbi:DNA-binding protein RFX5-like isoform X2 [Homalodisca vitripennis]|uniref:DNA-binding protein RFX5-like isoform X2 n=1 Tax=Homalodisca vitripennis TaxID=197043 RepID=UPI001EEA7787|nr:DNA-binding protein RFX5-like isoform X2 [Homalodisca vitripennis]